MNLDASDSNLRSPLEELAAARGKLAGRASMAVVELAADRGETTPVHVHEEPEALHVLAGTLTVFVGADTVRLSAGETFLAPAGVAHAHRADADRTSYLAASFVRSVDLYESFLAAVARPVAPTRAPEEHESDQVVEMLAAANGITVLGPPGDLPAAALAA
jgi:quercetin dioxygenase-like cupin family protein